jgi:hypothetical protein
VIASGNRNGQIILWDLSENISSAFGFQTENSEQKTSPQATENEGSSSNDGDESESEDRKKQNKTLMRIKKSI